MCGEKRGRDGLALLRTGSPPRMRGKAVLCGFPAGNVGITPAYAGKRGPRSAWGSACRDHPRVCGEKPVTTRFASSFWGSPPRMRGKVQLQPWQPTALGITPACAGKSAAQSLDRLCAGDHPRVCGEKVSWGNRHQEGLGSPPRMRGKVISSLQCDFLSGITPACAGKRKRSRLQRSGTGDHPRVCGEKLFDLTAKVTDKGSPPRMRGKDVYTVLKINPSGITPAYAGKRERNPA